MLIQYGYIWMGLPTPLRVRQYRKFSDWLYRRDEQQRTEIARLQAELDADDLMAREAELFEYIRQLETDNVRLKAQVATLERIIEREAEKTMKAGQP
jgi:hypothetical protein